MRAEPGHGALLPRAPHSSATGRRIRSPNTGSLCWRREKRPSPSDSGRAGLSRRIASQDYTSSRDGLERGAGLVFCAPDGPRNGSTALLGLTALPGVAPMGSGERRSSSARSSSATARDPARRRKTPRPGAAAGPGRRKLCPPASSGVWRGGRAGGHAPLGGARERRPRLRGLEGLLYHSRWAMRRRKIVL